MSCDHGVVCLEPTFTLLIRLQNDHDAQNV